MHPRTDAAAPGPTVPSGPMTRERRIRRLVRAAGIGALAGVVGTACMSAVMLPAQWLGILGTQPPRRVSDRALGVVGLGRHAQERERRLGTTVAHFAIGASAGSVVGVLRETTDRRIPGPALGAVFGTALWAVNYIAIAPALDLFPPPDRDRPGRPPVMLTANAVFGVVTAAVAERALGRPRNA
jgi:hypothetical protein